MNRVWRGAPRSLDQVRAALPVTGAWRPGDPPGRRQFARLGTDRPFVLEGGGMLRDVTLAYETWGELNPAGDNAILVCHALTGDSHAAGELGNGHPTPGWWDVLIGPGKPIDTDRWFVVCVNVLGGCQGTTGPASAHPDDGLPYGSRYPVVTIRDMVRSQAVLANQLGIPRWLAVIGGSMGGMQVLEWGVMFPERVASIVPIATTLAASAQQIAWWSTGRRMIRLDPRWRAGDYYDAEPGEGPSEGLAMARMVSQITFRSDDLFTDRFGREVVEPIEGFELWQRFQVERYLEYHGEKLARRFDANSYLLLTKAMDLHDLARARGSMDDAVRRITAPTLVMGVDSDFLYPTHQQQDIAGALLGNGVDVQYLEITSPHGHDGFLLEHEQVGGALHDFLIDVEKSL
jgi:homoserine O-acetyltransferase